MTEENKISIPEIDPDYFPQPMGKIEAAIFVALGTASLAALIGFAQRAAPLVQKVFPTP